MRWPAGALLALPLLVACEQDVVRPTQVLLFVDTDAAVASDALASFDSPPALFDRVEIAAFGPGQDEPCADCVRSFALSSGELADRAVSVGLPVRARTSGYRVRVRIYRSANTLDGLPRAESSLELVAELPLVEEGVKLSRTVLLLTDSVGIPTGTLRAPVETLPGRPSFSRVGTWAGARRIPCPSPPGEGEVCVPGGAFWMGSPLVPPQNDALSRLVVLSPFYLDAHEVRVGEARGSPSVRIGAERHLSAAEDAPGLFRRYCTFTASVGPYEELPVNCLRVEDASRYCEERSRVLPTEAQLEYVQGGLISAPFPWGSDLPLCEDAVWGRADKVGTGLCYAGGEPLPLPVGSARRDRLVLPTGTLFDLAGNVAEFTRDRWSRSTDPCWSRRGVFVDPECKIQGTTEPDVPAGDTLYVVRGGSWALSVPEMRAAKRTFLPGSFKQYFVGFRCARPL